MQKPELETRIHKLTEAELQRAEKLTYWELAVLHAALVGPYKVEVHGGTVGILRKLKA